MKYSRMPEKLPRLNGKNTYLPAGVGFALDDDSNCVETSIETEVGVRASPAVTLNCCSSEKSRSASLNGTACRRIDTWLLDTATSIGLLSIEVSAVVAKKL